MIISREYIERVRKPSFIIMSILGPVLMAALFVVPIWISMTDKSSHSIVVIDEGGLLSERKLAPAERVTYDYLNVSFEHMKKNFYKSDYTVILYIPKNILTSNRIILSYKKQPGIVLEERLKSNVENIIYEYQLQQNNIDLKKIEAYKPKLDLTTEKINETGESEKTSTGVSMAIGLGGAVIMYMFIFLYGVQVMRGVIEEKTSRIVEVIISSVRPFQLMMGKIVGVAMVGLTQFLIWIILTFALISVAQATLFKNVQVAKSEIPNVVNDPTRKLKVGENVTNIELSPQVKKNKQEVDVMKIYSDLMGRNFYLIIGSFIFYFIGGYLLYSSLFAAIGSAVDSETDTQQFMLPVTIPIILSFVVAQSVMQNPDGPMAFWFSIIPFTSPVVMMVRIPFVNPGWELALSMFLLVLGFIFTTWLAGRIYRTGILMYGKKVTFKELGKWLFYKG